MLNQFLKHIKRKAAAAAESGAAAEREGFENS
jgi:hypothetical protein